MEMFQEKFKTLLMQFFFGGGRGGVKVVGYVQVEDRSLCDELWTMLARFIVSYCQYIVKCVVLVISY